MSTYDPFHYHPPNGQESAAPPSKDTAPKEMPPPIPLTLILAATPKLGIGKANQLPWPQLKTEMAYFARVTKRISSTVLPPRQPQTKASAPPDRTYPQLDLPQTPPPHRVNAVIMGRKTWDSIPARFRPLKGRLNVVLTSSWHDEKWRRAVTVGSPEGPIAVERLEDFVGRLRTGNLGVPVAVERVFVIGGASIYKAALDLGEDDDGVADRVLLTKIKKDFDCDTFFPVDLDKDKSWRRCGFDELSEFVGEEVGGPLEEKGVEFEFCMFEKGKVVESG